MRFSVVTLFLVAGLSVAAPLARPADMPGMDDMDKPDSSDTSDSDAAPASPAAGLAGLKGLASGFKLPSLGGDATSGKLPYTCLANYQNSILRRKSLVASARA